MKLSKTTKRFLPLLALALPGMAGTISIQPSTLTVIPGQTFSVSVNATSVANIYGYQFDIGYNPAVVSAVSIAEGTFLSSAGSTIFIPGTIDNVAGSLTFTADTLVGAIPGKTGSGTLATVNFKALAAGSSGINLANVTMLDPTFATVAATTANGGVTVQPAVTGVPEPRTLSLLAWGSLALVALKRRSKSA